MGLMLIFAPRQAKCGYVSVGSKAPFCESVGYFRSTPMNGHLQSQSACLNDAKSRLMRRSKLSDYSVNLARRE